MANMRKDKNPMPAQPAKERINNFDEVALGYTHGQASDEAKRCLNCKHRPCVSGCPVGIDIPGFICKISEEDISGAYKILSESSSFPAVCGRVCPQEAQCEAKCVRGIKGEPVAIGRLERYAADYFFKNSDAETEKPDDNGIKVAVVGSGPAGLTCAGELRRLGYGVTVFEALHMPGGVLTYGIPEFRLPKRIVMSETERLKEAGVEILTNVIIGKTLSIDELLNSGYKAVFVGSGAGLPRFMNIPGENLCGVYSANEFLTRINLMGAGKEGNITPIMIGKRVAVVGGGNVAMDAARSAVRLGAEEVYIVYRRSKDELPARAEEVEHAEEEGVIFKFLISPVRIFGDANGNVKGMSCVKTEPGLPDESGRRSVSEVKGSEFELSLDTVIVAIGTSPNPLIKDATPGLKTERSGGISAGRGGATTKPGVFAGGDAVTGAATVILAMGAGKESAKAIDEYLKRV